MSIFVAALKVIKEKHAIMNGNINAEKMFSNENTRWIARVSRFILYSLLVQENENLTMQLWKSRLKAHQFIRNVLFIFLQVIFLSPLYRYQIEYVTIEQSGCV